MRARMIGERGRSKASNRRSRSTSTPEGSAQLGNQELQAHHRKRTLHPSAEVGPSNDAAEREADRMADRVMQNEAPSPRSAAKNASASSSSVGGGRPLDAAERSFFEPRFGMSFDEVRIHTGAAAAESAAALHASAYTLGSDVVFGKEPGGTEGRRLLAHELAHVAQARADGATSVIRRAPLQATGLVLYDDTELFKAPMRDYKKGVQKVLAKDTIIDVIGEIGLFYKAVESGTTGYVLRHKVDLPAADDAKYRPEPNRRIVLPATTAKAHTPVTPPAGWKRHTPDPLKVAICDDVVAQKDPYKGTPIGTQIYETINGTEYLFIADWHQHPDTPEEREKLEKIGKLGLLNWHRGCSVYEQ